MTSEQLKNQKKLLKKAYTYKVNTIKNCKSTVQECSTRHELNRLIKEAKADGCYSIVIIIRFNH